MTYCEYCGMGPLDDDRNHECQASLLAAIRQIVREEIRGGSGFASEVLHDASIGPVVLACTCHLKHPMADIGPWCPVHERGI